MASILKNEFLIVTGIFTLIFYIYPGLHSSSIEAQERNNPQLYQKPTEMNLDLALLREMESELAKEQPACEEQSARLKKELGRYYGQFVEQKRTLDERRLERFAPDAMDPNTVRLIAKLERLRYGRMEFIRESPLLFQMHQLLGRCYITLQKERQALTEFSAALRYTAFELQPTLDNSGEFSDQSPEELKNHESYFNHINRIFADPERLPEESNQEYQNSARRFRSLLSEYLKTRRELDEARWRIDAFIARRARGESSVDPDAARQEYQQLLANITQIFNQLQTIRNDVYSRYAREKLERDSDLLFQMALLVKRESGQRKRLERLRNRPLPYRGQGEEQEPDRTGFRRFTGYKVLLELAHHLAPQNLLYIKLLAEEYRRDQNRVVAIDYFKKYLTLLRDENPQPVNELRQGVMELGRLYSSVSNYIKAAEAYEEAVELPAPETSALENLAAIHFNHTGNNRRAAELYKILEERYAAIDQTGLSLQEWVKHRKALIEFARNQAAISRRTFRSDDELSHLSRARDEFKLIEDELLRIRLERDELQLKINELKAQLIKREDEDLQLQYYTLLNRELPERQSQVAFLESQIRAMNLPGVIERQAVIAFRRRQFQTAVLLYLEIIDRGPSPQTERARKNVEIINQTRKDGATRPLYMPPGHER